MSKVDKEPDLIEQIQSLSARIARVESSTTGHQVSSQGTLPTIVALPAAAGAGATATIHRATDLCGEIRLTTGSAPLSTGDVLRVTFVVAYLSIPHMFLSAESASSSSRMADVHIHAALDKFEIHAHTALANNTLYTWSYHAIEGRN